jgi:hypothetical protein
MSNLFEGLKENDLEELVLPMISVDEYESKLDDDSIVVAFYVLDREPSQDLNRFIQKGASSILDTDVSPAPNEDGYYVVFIEFLRDEEFPKKLLDTLGSLKGLTGIASWKCQIYGTEDILPVTDENLKANVRMVSLEEDQEPESSDLVEFFRPSDLDNMIIEGRKVVLEARGVSIELVLVDHGSHEAVYESNAVMSSATRLDETAIANSRRIERMLGDFWVAEQRGEHILVRHTLQEDVVLFRL